MIQRVQRYAVIKLASVLTFDTSKASNGEKFKRLRAHGDMIDGMPRSL